MPAAIDATPDDESSSQGQRIVFTRRRRRRHEMEAVSPPYGFSVEWIGSSQQPLRCIDLQFNTDPIFALTFSPDGSFMFSGGVDKCVRLWNIREILNRNVNSRPILMEKQHGEGGTYCISVSPNNHSIFSGGAQDKTVLVHDCETWVFSCHLFISLRSLSNNDVISVL